MDLEEETTTHKNRVFVYLQLVYEHLGSITTYYLLYNNNYSNDTYCPTIRTIRRCRFNSRTLRQLAFR